MADNVAVASSVYNLAGEARSRPNFLKSLIIGKITNPSGLSVGPAIVNGYRGSSALRIKKFIDWARSDPDFLTHIGVTNGALFNAQILNQDTIRNNIPVSGSEVVTELKSTYIHEGDISYWVLQHMLQNYPGVSGYTYKFNQATNTVTMTLPGGTVFTFNPVNFSVDGLYLYVHYVRINYVTFENRVLYFIYRRYSGNAALDSLFSGITPSMLGSFYPPIPFRFGNRPVSPNSADTNLMAIYPTCKKAFKKGFGIDFDDVQEKILDNDSIENIDHVYAIFGVPFNTEEQAGRGYIYRMVKTLLASTVNHTQSQETQWLSDWDNNVSRPTPPWKQLKVESVRFGTSNYKTEIRWAFLHEESGTGLIKGGARKGDYWFMTMGNPLVNYPADAGDGFNQRVALWWQETETTWKRLVVTGLQYNNYVYKTHKTLVTANTAIGTVGKDSEFLVPLHEGLFETSPLVDRLQMGNTCSYLLFACYEVDKEEWYESDWFKIVVVVVILVVSIVAAVVTGGGSLGVGGAAIAGLLTGAGLSTAAALIIAAAVEVMAGLLISFLISQVATALFGEEWGPLIGAIVSFIFSFGMSVGSVNDILTALSKPDVWIALASATAGGVASYMQAQAVKIAEDTAKMMEEYNQKTSEVQRMYNELQSGGRGDIDPSIVNRYIMETSEKPSDFFKRTLATGSDIVDITLKQIDNFTQINLQRMLP